MPGPMPARMANTPTLLLTIRTGAMFVLGLLLNVIWTEAIPRGALDGMIALTWVGLTKMGNPSTEVLPWMILMDTPPRLVDKGNAKGGLTAGPMLTPKMVKMEPWAMAPLGSPGDMKLAAFTIPRGEISGGWATRQAGIRKSPANKSEDLIIEGTSRSN